MADSKTVAEQNADSEKDNQANADNAADASKFDRVGKDVHQLVDNLYARIEALEGKGKK